MSFRTIIIACLIATTVLISPADADASYEDALRKARNFIDSDLADSARVLLDETLELTETIYGPSDSTVDLVFFKDGIPTRVYYPSFEVACEFYTELLALGEQIFDPNDPSNSDIRVKLSEAHRALGKYYDAGPLLVRELDIRQQAFGSYDARVAEILDLLGVIYYYQGKDIDAITYIDSAFTMRDSLLGPDHPSVAWSCLNMARVLIKLGYYDDAEQLARRAMSIVEARFGTASVEMADCLEWIGMSLYFRDENAAAESLYVKALDIRRQQLGPNHRDVATMYLRLANAYRYMDRYDESDSLYIQAVELRKAVFGPDHPEVAEVLYYRGLLHQNNLSDYRLAESLYTEAYIIRQRTLDSLHPDFAELLFRLGQTTRDSQQLQKAEDYASRALALRETIYGKQHRKYYDALSVFANVLSDQGRFIEALPLFERRTDLAAELFGPESRVVASNLSDLGWTHYRLGAFDLAENYFRRAEVKYRELYGPKHPEVAAQLGALGLVSEAQGRYDEAVTHFNQALAMFEDDPHSRQTEGFATLNINLAITQLLQMRYEEAEGHIKSAIEILEELFGPTYSNVAAGLLNLGLAFEGQGRYREADSAYRLSIEIGEAAFGIQNPMLAHALNNLANLSSRLGRYSEADSLQKRAVSILEGALGPEHPEVAKFRRDQGRILAYAGKTAGSLKAYDKFIDQSQRYLENVFPYSSEQQKLLWLDKYPLFDHTLFSMALSDGSADSRKLALEMLLKSKAMVIETVMAEKKAAYCFYDDETLAQLDELNGVLSEIASLSMAGGYYRDSVEVLYDVKDSLEIAISRHCSEFSDALAARRFEVDGVLKAIPNGGVLWEFMRYEPSDLDPAVTGNAKLGPTRYLAFTADNTGQITIRDLGAASVIDSLILTARDILYRSQGQIYSVAAVTSEQRLSEVTGRLYQMLFAPLLSSLKSNEDIYIAPDALLNLLPFEILPLPGGSYAIERHRISYLSSGRDLLKYKDGVFPTGDVFVFADPDFDGLADTTETKVIMSDELYGPDMRGSTGCLNEKFNPLSYSRNEASSVIACFRQSGVKAVNECYGRRAAEERLKAFASSPRVLHLATHGFFCESVDSSTALRDSPLLRSGLALTGANRTIAGERDETDKGDDGILTALEVSGLNLVGTELAVLSACESGVGDLVNGEGVFGLRRAFQHAGAQTVVMSLWPIPDRETSQLMDGFYRRWLGGMSKRDALRESAISVLSDSRNKRGCGHPLLWGGFILTGNPN